MCDSRAALLWLSVFKVLVTLYDLTCSIICVNTALQSGNLKQNFSRSSNNTETKNNMITYLHRAFREVWNSSPFSSKIRSQRAFCSCGADLCFFCSFQVAGIAGNTYLH